MSMRCSVLTILVLLVTRGASAQLPESANTLQEGHLPTPYNAAELRRDCTAGAWRTYRTETLQSSAWRVTTQTTRFVSSGRESVEIESVEGDSSGNALSDPQSFSATWVELQRHASFPREDTTIERVPVELGCGAFDAWLYTLVTDHGGREKRLWFATDLAGAPILMEEWWQGRLVFRTTLVDYGPPE